MTKIVRMRITTGLMHNLNHSYAVIGVSSARKGVSGSLKRCSRDTPDPSVLTLRVPCNRCDILSNQSASILTCKTVYTCIPISDKSRLIESGAYAENNLHQLQERQKALRKLSRCPHSPCTNADSLKFAFFTGNSRAAHFEEQSVMDRKPL